MSKRIILIALAGLVPAIASCATAGRTPASGPVTLQVTNSNPESVDVYVLFDGFKQRMGTVSAAQEASFRVPDRALDSVSGLHVVIDPIGSRTDFVTGRINGVDVEPGSTIEVEVAADLSATWWQVHQGNPSPGAEPQPSGSHARAASR
jgi:hypothetical protein